MNRYRLVYYRVDDPCESGGLPKSHTIEIAAPSAADAVYIAPTRLREWPMDLHIVDIVPLLSAVEDLPDRDGIATAAMAAILAKGMNDGTQWDNSYYSQVAGVAYQMADAMLRARGEPPVFSTATRSQFSPTEQHL